MSILEPLSQHRLPPHRRRRAHNDDGADTAIHVVVLTTIFASLAPLHLVARQAISAAALQFRRFPPVVLASLASLPPNLLCSISQDFLKLKAPRIMRNFELSSTTSSHQDIYCIVMCLFRA